MAEEKKDGWFFNKSILAEINETEKEPREISDDMVASQVRRKSKEESFEGLKRQLIRIKKENKQLREQQESERAQWQTKTEEFEKMNREWTQLQGEHEKLLEQIRVKKEWVSPETLAFLQNEAEETITRLTKELAQAREQQKDARTQLKKIGAEQEIQNEKRLTSLKEECNQLKQTIQQLTDKQKAQQTNEQEKQQLATEPEMERIKRVLLQLKKEKATIERANKQLTTQLEQTTQQLEKEQLFAAEQAVQLKQEKNTIEQTLHQVQLELVQTQETLQIFETKLQNVLQQEKEQMKMEQASPFVSLDRKDDELIQANQQIQELMEQNSKLKKEVKYLQQEIGEVLVVAKKQAKNMLDEAQVEAKNLINSAELSVEAIGTHAKKISVEVAESRKNVVAIYEEIQKRSHQLMEGGSLSNKEGDQ
ncbi:hypothetical protein IGI37_003738 [Enterococcus sp. AZ194]|uniref:hypothetical protein n=1 Tax=Enterococcus sp. AZ194 TaxID=2774629 RepID=UPI003F260A34